MKKIVPIILLLLWSATVHGKTLIKTVAIVNNDAVTSYQLEKKLAATMLDNENQRRFSKEEHASLKLKVLNGMIEDLLVEQRIREIGLSVSDNELTSAIEDVQRQNKLTSEQLKTALRAQGISFADYRQNLRKEILRYKLIAKEVRSKVEVNNAEIRTYFDAHAAEYMAQPTIRLGRISYPLTKDATDDMKVQLIQKAQVARQQLLGGKPFADVLASLGSDAQGGDMGNMNEKELNTHLHQMVNGLKVSQVSEPMETRGSIHIFQILERTPAKSELTEQVSEEIEKILVEKNSEKRFSEWKKSLRKDAVIEIRI